MEKKSFFELDNTHTHTHSFVFKETSHLSSRLLPPVHCLPLYSLQPEWLGYEAELIPLVPGWLFSHLCVPQLLESQKELLGIEFTLPERWQTGREGMGAWMPSWLVL